MSTYAAILVLPHFFDKCERNHSVEKTYKCKECGNPLGIASLFANTNGLTLERNPLNVSSVVKPSVVPVPNEDMKGLTPERNPMNVRTVRKPLVTHHVFANT